MEWAGEERGRVLVLSDASQNEHLLSYKLAIKTPKMSLWTDNSKPSNNPFKGQFSY